MPHVKLRNSFEALLEEEDLLQNQRANNVEEVVVCTPDALLGKSGSIGLRAVKEWLRTGGVKKAHQAVPKLRSCMRQDKYL